MLSILVPVYNAEAYLARLVNELLDILPDIAPDFEVVLIDDGSTDQTEEIAADLAQQFPQVQLVHHPSRLGRAAAVNSGLLTACGDVVILHEEEGPVSSQKLRQLWNLRGDDELLMARASSGPGTLDPELMYRLATWGALMRKSPLKRTDQGGPRLMRRKALGSLVRS